MCMPMLHVDAPNLAALLRREAKCRAAKGEDDEHGAVRGELLLARDAGVALDHPAAWK